MRREATHYSTTTYLLLILLCSITPKETWPTQ